MSGCKYIPKADPRDKVCFNADANLPDGAQAVIKIELLGTNKRKDEILYSWEINAAGKDKRISHEVDLRQIHQDNNLSYSESGVLKGSLIVEDKTLPAQDVALNYGTVLKHELWGKDKDKQTFDELDNVARGKLRTNGDRTYKYIESKQTIAEDDVALIQKALTSMKIPNIDNTNGILDQNFDKMARIFKAAYKIRQGDSKIHEFDRSLIIDAVVNGVVTKDTLLAIDEALMNKWEYKPAFSMTIIELGSKDTIKYGIPYDARIELTTERGTVIVRGNTWPDLKYENPGIASGTYPGVYSKTGHRPPKKPPREGIRLEKIPTVCPNPIQQGENFATSINIHSGGETIRGSEGCITIHKNDAHKIWNMLEEGDSGLVTVIRLKAGSYDDDNFNSTREYHA
jgi:hypothetical protein